MSLISNHQDGLLLVISGPSGVGKTTITRRVEQELGAVFSVSMTTRPKTAADTEGQDYIFVSPEQFELHCDAGDLLEWAEVFGQSYGTPRQPVEEHLGSGRLVLLEIDVEGAIQIKQRMPLAFALFVCPPSELVLLERLRNRQRDNEQSIQRRFAKAKDEIARGQACGIYDHFITNDDLDTAVAEVVRWVRRSWHGGGK